MRRALLIALVVLVAGPVSGAAAIEAPQIMYREGVEETSATGPWLPLDGANISSLGFVLGTKMLAKGPMDPAVYYRATMTSVPDGHPDQGPGFGTCISRAQMVGSDVVLTEGLFEGPGTYTLTLEANTSCGGGPVSTATFTIDPRVGVELVEGDSVFLEGPPLARIARVTDLPVGGAGDMQCARDATAQPDGSLAGTPVVDIPGPSVIRRLIPRTGAWTCVGRARSTGSHPDGEHFTRWSGPVSFFASAPFGARVVLADASFPTYALAYRNMPPGAAGGRATLRIAPGDKCPKVRVRTLRARVPADGRVRFRFRLPERNKSRNFRPGVDSYGWLFTLRFEGTREIRRASFKTAGFVLPRRFSGGHKLSFGGIDLAYCTYVE